MEERKVEIGEIYRHFKGGLYMIILTDVIHTEDNEELIVYQSIKDHTIYARPKAMFLSEVDHEKYPDVKQKYRLEKVEGTRGVGYYV